MARIDATGLRFNVFTGDPSYVTFGAARSDSATHYSWGTDETAPFYAITALSSKGDINAGSFTGTISTINIALFPSGPPNPPGFSILDLNVQLSDLVHPGATDEAQADLFWRAVLAGPTTVMLPTSNTAAFSTSGDFIGVRAGDTLTGSADTFIGSLGGPDSSGTGDAVSTEAGSRLNGGKDIFSQVGSAVGDVAGGIGVTSNGLVYGGDDVFTLNDTAPAASLRVSGYVGDVAANGPTGEVHGGNDTFTVRNADDVGLIIGDVGANSRVSFGGNDTITAETTIAGRAYMSVGAISGDDSAVTNGAATLEGGNDTIALLNVTGTYLVGDAINVTSGILTGGDDTISYRAGFTSQDPIGIGTVSGDAWTGETGSFVTGGNDLITLTNAAATLITGDIDMLSGGGKLVGGDDTISVSHHRGDSSFGGTITGDATAVTAPNFTGGDDRITLDAAANGAVTPVLIYGDANAVSSGNSLIAICGDDTITLISETQGGTIYGDADRISAGTQLALTHGDDLLTGGQAGDTLYGDTTTLSYGSGDALNTGGNDTLDGRGGNDELYGLKGIDTAVFSLDQSVYVDLTGIPDSAPTPSGWYQAIGQGNDHFISIENVTGSARADTIWGDGNANVLNGGGGADTLGGRGGNDTYSVNQSSDQVVEKAGEGSDTVYASASFSLGAGQSVELLRTDANADTTAITLNGNELAQRVSGNAGANTLDGKGGADTMTGYGGNDTYRVDGGGDVVIEAAGGGSDTVQAGASYTLAAGQSVEQLRTTAVAGTTAINLTGNELAQSLYGNAGDNLLTGGAGADTMTGYGGNDTYRVDNAADKVIEAAGGGSDTVSASTSFVLGSGQSVEVLQASVASATTAMNLTGNELANTLLGNAGANLLNGGAGQDILDLRVDAAQDIARFTAVSHSTGSARDIVKNFDFTEDKFDFTLVPGAVGFVTAGSLSEGAGFEAQMKAAVDLALAVDGAVLFTANGGGLTGHTFLVLDANHDGVYTGGSDYVVELVGATGGNAALTTSDFI